MTSKFKRYYTNYEICGKMKWDFLAAMNASNV